GQDPVNQDRLQTFYVKVPDWANVRRTNTAADRFQWRVLAAGYQRSKIAIGNPNAALGSAMRRDGYWALGNEVDCAYGGKTYRLRLGRRADGTAEAIYYCEVPIWSKVYRITGPTAESFRIQSPIKEIAPRVTVGGHWRAPRLYNNVWYDHEGIDLDAYEFGRALNVSAAAEGTVITVRRTDPGTGYGRYVRLRHEHNNDVYYTWYAHLASVSSVLAVGTRVSAGQFLGVAGSS